MDSFKDSITFWATVLGTLTGFIGLFQSRAWLVVIGTVIACGSIATLLYAKSERGRVRSALLKIGERSIDSLNLAGLRRHLNRSLVIQEVKNLAIIDAEDLTVTWECSGYCRANRETTIEFSIDADAYTPYERLDCVAFDIRRDPQRRHAIRPILVSPDGLSKKIAVPFLAPLAAQEPFCVMVRWHQAHCMKPGIDYYTATLSFDQNRVQHYAVGLRFLDGLPKWVHVYELASGGTANVLKDLHPAIMEDRTVEYWDIDNDVAAQSARVYLFSRPQSDHERRSGPSKEEMASSHVSR